MPRTIHGFGCGNQLQTFWAVQTSGHWDGQTSRFACGPLGLHLANPWTSKGHGSVCIPWGSEAGTFKRIISTVAMSIYIYTIYNMNYDVYTYNYMYIHIYIYIYIYVFIYHPYIFTIYLNMYSVFAILWGKYSSNMSPLSTRNCYWSTVYISFRLFWDLDAMTKYCNLGAQRVCIIQNNRTFCHVAGIIGTHCK